jgi:hypothetical protein
MIADGTQKGVLTVGSFKFNMSFQLGSISDVKFDGTSLLGKTTSLNLSEKKSHELIFVCK